MIVKDGGEAHSRRIIQISAINHPASGGGYYALCDDGSVWQRVFDGSREKWIHEPDIPQDKPGPEPEF